MHILRECKIDNGCKIEESKASFKVENQKSENAQALNKISRYLNQPIRFKQWNTEVDNFSQFLAKLPYSYATCALKTIKPAAKFYPSDNIYDSDINKEVSLNKKLNKTENNKDITNDSFLRKKSQCLPSEESDEIFDDMVKQMSICAILKGSSIQYWDFKRFW